MSGALEGIYEPGVVDPGIPLPRPTQSFWQSEEHPLANHQSPWPEGVVDVVIIGSGITGMSLARTISRERPGMKVVMIEARALCSGATGRNGGHMKTMTFAVWPERKAAFGLEEAVRISAFEHAHLEAMSAAIREDQIVCDLVPTEGIEAFYDRATFGRAVAGLEDMRKHAPSLANKHTVYTDRRPLQESMNFRRGAWAQLAVQQLQYGLTNGSPALSKN
jgi:glycine/D-amino acid oxidase-like deaminating enzyme